VPKVAGVAIFPHPSPALCIPVGLVRRMASGETATLDLLDRALQNPHGGDHTSAQSNVDNVHVAERPAGNGQARALRKLRKDAPELHTQVLEEHRG
jgi:hypothetical protein